MNKIIGPSAPASASGYAIPNAVAPNALQPNSKCLVTVTSAINASSAHSRFTNAERAAQTRATVDSIRAHIPNAVILVADASVQRPEPSIVDQLGDGVQFAWFGHLPELQEIARHPNFNIVKNLSELTFYSQLLGSLLSTNSLAGYRRIFKVSGRYQLSDRFDLSRHLSAAARDRFIFARRSPATWNFEQVGTTYAWQTRLFSYDPGLAHLLASLYLVALRSMHERLAQGLYTDIEHSLARLINPNLVLELDVIGVQGKLGTYDLHVDE